MKTLKEYKENREFVVKKANQIKIGQTVYINNYEASEGNCTFGGNNIIESTVKGISTSGMLKVISKVENLDVEHYVNLNDVYFSKEEAQAVVDIKDILT